MRSTGKNLTMKTNFYTSESEVEDNARKALSLFESKDEIDSISVFPDIHYCSERSIPVGVAFKTTDWFYPLVTGKDMGCGVAYLRIDKKDYLKPFDKAKHYRAFDRESQYMTDEGLGGGNHFLSLEESDKYLYIIVHTGSRNLGIYMYQKNYGLIRELGDGVDKLPIEVATEDYIKEYNSVLEYAEKRRYEFLKKSLLFLVKNGYVPDNVSFEIKDSTHNSLEFTGESVIHRKGSTHLYTDEVVIPISMSRGSLIVKPNIWDPELEKALYSCSHGAGRKLSRTDTLKHWHSLKKAIKEDFKSRFSELLEKNGDFPSSILQEFDFAYKDSSEILSSQSYLIKVDETRPIVTVKFTGV